MVRHKTNDHHRTKPDYARWYGIIMALVILLALESAVVLATL